MLIDILDQTTNKAFEGLRYISRPTNTDIYSTCAGWTKIR